MTNPTLILVPGAWHKVCIYNKVLENQALSSFKHILVELPTNGATGDPELPTTLSWDPDVHAIRDAIAAEIKAGNRVLLVTHSYGSVVGQEALKYFADEMGMIRHLIIAGFLLDVGESTTGLRGGKEPEWYDLRGNLVYVRDGAKRFYNDLPESEAAKLEAELLPQTLVTKSSPITYPAWKHVPTTYLSCENDAAIPIERQRWMIERAQKTARDFKVVTCSAGHSPFLSMPEVVADLIQKTAGEF